MKIIRPFEVTDAVLTSSLPETPPPVYSGVTTYALNDTASVMSGTTATVYISLQAGNIGHTPASSPTFWRQLATAYSVYSGPTTYAKGQIVTDIVAHRLYQSEIASNTGNTPGTTAADGKWTDIGPSNRWAMFDQVNGTVAQAHGSITVSVATTGRVNSLALIGLDGVSSVNVRMVAGAVEVYNKTFNLVNYSEVSDWYEYFFEDVSFQTNFALTDLPVYLDAVVTVTLTGLDGIGVGTLVLGRLRELGDVVYGATLGIQDFSRKEYDDFGRALIVPRASSDRARFPVVVRGDSYPQCAARVDAVKKILTDYRATPVVWIGVEDFASTILYGFFRSFDIEIAYPNQSNLTLEIEGLT